MPPRDRSSRYERAARAAAKKYNLPTRLFLSMINTESSWNPAAISSAGAIGLGQLMPGTARGLGVDPFDPDQNIDGAARYLQQMYERTGNWRNALRAYNQGPNGIADPDAGAEYAHAVMEGRRLYGRGAPRGSGRGPSSPLAPPPPALPTAPQSLSGEHQTLAQALFGDDPDFLPFALAVGRRADAPRIVDVPDEVVQGARIVSPGGSVKRVPLPKGGGNGAQGVIAAAQSQLGKPYVFGSGPSTDSFDCSDLVQWAYAQIGIKLPRVTYDQIKVGRGVSWDDLEPGDLIFPNRGHVVMYAGNGKVIAAPYTGTVVQMQDAARFKTDEVVIRRVL